MADVRGKLNFLEILGKHGVMTGAQWRADLQRVEEERLAGNYEIGSVVNGSAVGENGLSFFLAREEFPLDTRHGECALGDALAAAGKHISLSANDAELVDFDPRTTVFIDTETTGLAGGTGTVAFLVGVGYFTEATFRLDQCFMRDYDDEEPMLRFLAEPFRNAKTLVSYNGKSFDLPLLRTRYIANRIPFHLDGAMHFDLVHASRRFWKKRLQNCTLGNIEREILGVERECDIESYLIPQIWLDYLYSRDARRLREVFHHHKFDILSLVSLTASLSRRLGCPDGQGFEHQEDQVSLVRVHFQQRRYEDVLRLSDGFAAVITEEHLRRESLEMRGYAGKRLQQWEVMEDAWRRLVTEFPNHMEARAELAKHYEHRARDLGEARRICAEGVQLLETRRALTPHLIQAGHLDELRRRLERIEFKLAKIDRKYMETVE